MSDDITPARMSKSEAWELTDEIRSGFETIHENRMAQVERLARAYEGQAWEPMGYETFDEYKSEEFGDDLQHQRLELEERIGAVKVLHDSGMAKVQIADVLGVHRNTVTNLLKRIDAQPDETAQGCASTEVDAAGQSVEEVGHIEDDEPPLQIDADSTPPVAEEVQQVETNNDDDDDEQRRRMEAWMNSLSVESMVIIPPAQIIESEASEDTSNYFVTRQSAPSWSPPQVAELPPPRPKAYDSIQGDFVEPALTLPKSVEPNKADEHVKHCKTCACNLLP